MDSLKEWITTILVAAFIINLIDLIIPSGNLKPYVNLILNFIFMLVIITPIIDNFKTGMSIEDGILKEYNDFQYKYSQKTMSSDNVNTNELKENYNNYLKESLNMKLKEYGYELEDIQIENNEIKNIQVKESNSDKNSNNDTTKEIKFKGSENSRATFKEELNKEREIKNELNKVFNVSVEKNTN